jgi:pimeloyl-ACP methyl ester carboxylesterase
MVLFLRFFNRILSVMRPTLIPFGIYIKWKFLVIFLLATLTTFLLHLGWTKWLLSDPQPLPQQSNISTGKKNRLERGIYYETSVPITDTDNHILANYRIWIPNGVETVRGVIVRQHGCGGDDTTDMGLVYANDLHWQALAIKHQLAILGTKYQTVGIYPDDPCDSWAVIDRGSEDAFLKSLNEFGQKSRHPELGKLPWVLWGYSGGADWAVQMSHKYPDRTIALISMRGGGVNISHSEPLKLLTSDINPNVLGMPVSNYKGDPLQAAWLPNKEIAYKWQAYVSNPNLFEKARYSFCSHKSFVTLIGAPHLYQSCYPNRVSPTRKPNAPDDLRAVRIGATEVVLNWDFTPDLENGLPKFGFIVTTL